jgi:hypothetical protein
MNRQEGGISRMIILTPNEWSTTEDSFNLIVTELHVPINLENEKEKNEG